jgi:hypothetical protein
VRVSDRPIQIVANVTFNKLKALFRQNGPAVFGIHPGLVASIRTVGEHKANMVSFCQYPVRTVEKQWRDALRT